MQLCLLLLCTWLELPVLLQRKPSLRRKTVLFVFIILIITRGDRRFLTAYLTTAFLCLKASSAGGSQVMLILPPRLLVLVGRLSLLLPCFLLLLKLHALSWPWYLKLLWRPHWSATSMWLMSLHETSVFHSNLVHWSLSSTLGCSGYDRNKAMQRGWINERMYCYWMDACCINKSPIKMYLAKRKKKTRTHTHKRQACGCLNGLKLCYAAGQWHLFKTCCC